MEITLTVEQLEFILDLCKKASVKNATIESTNLDGVVAIKLADGKLLLDKNCNTHEISSRPHWRDQ